jgi:hypothetical protein
MRFLIPEMRPQIITWPFTDLSKEPLTLAVLKGIGFFVVIKFS